MLKMPASLASLTWMSPALPVKLHGAERVHRHAGRADRMALGLQAARRIDRQLAVLLRPAFLHRARALPFRREPHRLVFDQLGDGEAVVRLDQRQIAERDAGVGERPLPGLGAAFELQDVALAHRQEILHMRGRAERDRLAQPQRGLDVGQHQRGRAVGHQRAVGALERTGDERILLARRCGRNRSRDPCATARRDCRRRSCGFSPRSSPARRTGRPSAGNRARRSCRKFRQSRPRCRPPRARRRLSTGFFRSPARASSSSARRRPPERCGPTSRRSPAAPAGPRRNPWRRRSRPASRA